MSSNKNAWNYKLMKINGYRVQRCETELPKYILSFNADNRHSG